MPRDGRLGLLILARGRPRFASFCVMGRQRRTHENGNGLGLGVLGVHPALGSFPPSSTPLFLASYWLHLALVPETEASALRQRMGRPWRRPNHNLREGAVVPWTGEKGHTAAAGQNGRPKSSRDENTKLLQTVSGQGSKLPLARTQLRGPHMLQPSGQCNSRGRLVAGPPQ